MGTPTGDMEVHAGDTLVLYGPVERIEELDQRSRGKRGDAAHREAVEEHEEDLEEQEQLDEQMEEQRRSIEAEERGVVVDCLVTSAGSVRVDEIMDLLVLRQEDLAGPVRRLAVKWLKV